MRVKRQRLNGDMGQHPTGSEGGTKGNASGPGLASHFLIHYFVYAVSAISSAPLKKNNHTESTEQ